MDDARSAKVNQSKCLILSLLHRCGSAADAASKASATVATHTTRGKRHGATISVPKLNVALCRPGRRASDLREDAAWWPGAAFAWMRRTYGRSDRSRQRSRAAARELRRERMPPIVRSWVRVKRTVTRDFPAASGT